MGINSCRLQHWSSPFVYETVMSWPLLHILAQFDDLEVAAAQAVVLFCEWVSESSQNWITLTWSSFEPRCLLECLPVPGSMGGGTQYVVT
jgi:hypothetical protein